jgi:nucleolar pre-ribosomal-associated protein 1
MVTDESLLQGLQATVGSCIYLLLKLIPTRVAEFVAILLDQLQALPVTSLTAEMMVIGRRLHVIDSDHGKPFLTALADHGVQWAVRHFAEDLHGLSDVSIEELSMLIFSTLADPYLMTPYLASVVRLTSGTKPHLADTLVGVIVRNQLSNVTALALAAAVVKTVPLKVNF